MTERLFQALDEAEERIGEVRAELLGDRKPPEAQMEQKAAGQGWTIKFDAEEELYMELLIESRRKRVSMKYLMLEILQAQGYTVDLTKAQQDGRRSR